MDQQNSAAADRSELCRLLQLACTRFEALGNQPVWTRYNSAPEIAWQIMKWIPKIHNDRLSKEEAIEMWEIFAPTCDCDDVLQDGDFCQRVFENIEKLYPR